jgi:hypothetical protein
MTIKKTNGIPIAPGCVLAEVTCGDDCRCEMGHFCETHQEPGDEWPCEEQEAYEQTPEVQVEIARGEVAVLRERLADQDAQFGKLDRDHAALRRLVEQAIVPFMRDALANILDGSLQISWGIGDSEPLLGIDVRGFADNDYSFNRGRKQGTQHGITYTASDGTVWENGTRVPKKAVKSE